MAAFDREIIMLKKIVFAASAAALVLGAGTAALATSGSAGSPGAPGKSAAPSSPGALGESAAPGAAARGPKAHKPALKALGRALHAEWVTRDRDNDNAFVTHHAIRGEVTAVSATSITVKALDGVTQTYAITSDTKVHLRKNLPGRGNGGQGNGNGNGNGNGGQGSGGAGGSISDVHTGDRVAVTGVGTSSLTAAHVVDATK